ncbi:MAG: chromosomal replication initiator protein DnaA [Candidatus Cyclonatronum sp.]|uniref:chromosomal replication initiator protein DnaA n=1 Tax=Cyclonatronum sp. TaxID=3024185 RepID=UPI0025BB8FE5|nr:chromosomal replication initiator protein DnaA [Cyclonatronum sp.]MCH8485500.1 chromosomal replication initiator protein DnaA [Cyclonatronum sp.]
MSLQETNVSHEIARAKWAQCLTLIKDKINAQKYSAWFEPIVPLRIEGQTLTIQVPSQFWYEWLEEHYYTILRNTIQSVIGRDGKLQYSIKVESKNEAYAPPAASVNLPQRSMPGTQPYHNSLNDLPRYQTNQIQNPFVIPGIQKNRLNSNLNSSYVFDRFIEGDCNRLARSAGIAIAENPGANSFNPFFIYGGTGLGKTHLTQSIGNKIRNDFGNEKNILYITSDDFTNEFVRAIRNNRASEFSMMYRNIDVLIIDDIQFFSGKEKTQEEFFHIFNALHQEGKQIILTSDRPPKDISDIEDRLISRFKWGLTADLQMPDYETRFAILERKAIDNGIEFEPQILEFIATNFKSSVRDLEGAIIKLLAASSLQQIDHIDLPMAKRILKDMIKETTKQVTVENIQALVCDFFGIDTNKVREKTRKQEIVEARQIAMYLSKKLTKSSLKSIGLQFGGRDHSTVIHAITTIEDRIQTSQRHAQIVKELTQKIELASL